MRKLAVLSMIIGTLPRVVVQRNLPAAMTHNLLGRDKADCT